MLLSLLSQTQQLRVSLLFVVFLWVFLILEFKLHANKLLFMHLLSKVCSIYMQKKELESIGGFQLETHYCLLYIYVLWVFLCMVVLLSNMKSLC